LAVTLQRKKKMASIIAWIVVFITPHSLQCDDLGRFRLLIDRDFRKSSSALRRSLFFVEQKADLLFLSPRQQSS